MALQFVAPLGALSENRAAFALARTPLRQPPRSFTGWVALRIVVTLGSFPKGVM